MQKIERNNRFSEEHRHQSRRAHLRYGTCSRLAPFVVFLCGLPLAGCQDEPVGNLEGSIALDGGDELVFFDLRAGYVVDSNELSFKTRESIRRLDFIIEYEAPKLPLTGVFDLADDSDSLELSFVHELANGNKAFHTVRSGELVIDHYPSQEEPTWSGHILADIVSTSEELDAKLDAHFYLEIPRDTLALALE